MVDGTTLVTTHGASYGKVCQGSTSGPEEILGGCDAIKAEQVLNQNGNAQFNLVIQHSTDTVYDLGVVVRFSSPLRPGEKPLVVRTYDGF